MQAVCHVEYGLKPGPGGGCQMQAVSSLEYGLKPGPDGGCQRGFLVALADRLLFGWGNPPANGNQEVFSSEKATYSQIYDCRT